MGFGLCFTLTNMPIVSRKQYAELCGDDILKINKWIQRGKISVSAVNKKLIDTKNAINASFMADRRRFNAMESFNREVPENSTLTEKVSKSEPKKAKIVSKIAKTVTNIPKNVTESKVKSVGRPAKVVERHHFKPKNTPVKPAEPKEIQVFDKRIAEQSARDERRVDQDMQKKGLEIDNLELAKQQKLLQLNKSAGNLLPVDLVKGVLKRHGDTFFKTFEKSIERFISIIAGSDQETYVKHMATLKEMLSKSIQDAGKLADAEILILVNDYSETLARGQKKV